MSDWQCPWCGASRRRAYLECPESCGWTAAAHPASLAAVQVAGVYHGATGANPARAREALGMALHAAGVDRGLADQAQVSDAPDAGPWSFRWAGGQFVDVSRPGAVEVDQVDLWDSFDLDSLRIGAVTEFLRLCCRWLVEWADRFDRDGD